MITTNRSSENPATNTSFSLADQFRDALSQASRIQTSRSTSDGVSNTSAVSSTEKEFDLPGRADDYNFFIKPDGETFSIYYSKRNAEGPDASSENRVKLGSNVTTINFKVPGSPDWTAIDVEDLKSQYEIFGNGKDELRFSIGEDGPGTDDGEYYNTPSVKNNIYRGYDNKVDFVTAGNGNDQFRLNALDKSGDVFFGSGGVDTLYLKGQPSEYDFTYNADEALTLVTYKGDPEGKMGFLFLSDVERVRFDDGGKKINHENASGDRKDYVSLDKLITKR